LFDMSRTGEYDVTVSRTLVPQLFLQQPRAGETQPGRVDLTAGPLMVHMTEDRLLTSRPTPVTIPSSHGAFLYLSNDASPRNQPGDVVYRYRIESSGRPVPILGPPVFGGKATHAVATTPDGRFLYATNAGDATVSQFRIGDNGKLSSLNPPTVSCGQYARFLLMDPHGRFVYALGYPSNTLYSIDRDGQLSLTAAMPSESWAKDPGHTVVPCDAGVIDPTGSFLYACNGKTFCYHLRPAGQVMDVIPVKYADDGRDVAIALSPSGRFAFVGNSRRNSTSTFDRVAPMRVNADGTLSPLPGTQPVLGPDGQLSTQARALAVDPSGHFLLVLDQASVMRYRIGADGSLSPLGAISVSGGPIAMLFGPDEHTVYTLNSHYNSVTTFRMDDQGWLVQVGLDTPNGGPYAGGITMATAPTPREWGPAAGGVEMSMRLTYEVLPVNTPVVLKVTLRNSTPRPVLLGTTGADMALLHLSLTGPSAGSLLSAGHDLLDSARPSVTPLMLAPGGERQYRLVLSRLLDLSLTGEYTVQVSRALPGGGTAEAPPVRFRLQEPYEGLSGDFLERMQGRGLGERPLEIL